MNKIFSLALAAVFLAACNTSGSRNSEAPATPPAALPATPSVQLPANNPSAITTTPPAQVAPATGNGNAQVALNPAHGAPGHSCEIPVGAPLNTAATSAPAITTPANAAPVMMTPPAQSMPANGNVRLNPAHGAPGHDCAIPVGQPLRS